MARRSYTAMEIGNEANNVGYHSRPVALPTFLSLTNPNGLFSAVEPPITISLVIIPFSMTPNPEHCARHFRLVGELFVFKLE